MNNITFVVVLFVHAGCLRFMPPRTLYFICSGLLNLSLLGRSLRDVIQSKMCSLDVYRLINDNTTVKRQYFYYNKFLQTTLATAIWKKIKMFGPIP